MIKNKINIKGNGVKERRSRKNKTISKQICDNKPDTQTINKEICENKQTNNKKPNKEEQNMRNGDWTQAEAGVRECVRAFLRPPPSRSPLPNPLIRGGAARPHCRRVALIKKKEKKEKGRKKKEKIKDYSAYTYYEDSALLARIIGKHAAPLPVES